MATPPEGNFNAQIKEIIEALHDIRSQLAEQNKYLDVLTETYVRKPAEIEFEDDWESEFEGDETLNVEMEFTDFDDFENQKWDSQDKMDEQDQLDSQDQFQDDIPVNDTLQWTKELSTLPGRYPDHEPIDVDRYTQTVTATTMFYLPMGIISSFFAMNRFSQKSGTGPSQTSFNTMFVVLLLVVYIFAACALWFAREEGWIREILTSWVPTKTVQGKRAAPQRSAFPRKRRAWEPVI
ncbi:hypothetical protein BDV18DRAFT_135920 [Aspergillus unguis]